MKQHNANPRSLRFLLRLLKPYLLPALGTALIGALTVLANTGLLALSAILICLASLMPLLLSLSPTAAVLKCATMLLPSLYPRSRLKYTFWSLEIFLPLPCNLFTKGQKTSLIL